MPFPSIDAFPVNRCLARGCLARHSMPCPSVDALSLPICAARPSRMLELSKQLVLVKGSNCLLWKIATLKRLDLLTTSLSRQRLGRTLLLLLVLRCCLMLLDQIVRCCSTVLMLLFERLVEIVDDKRYYQLSRS